MKPVFFFSVIIFSSLQNPAFVFGGSGNDTLFPGQSLYFDGPGLVSNNGLYQLGFFDGYYLTISFGDNNNIVWKANIDSNWDPIILNLSKNGALVLLDHYSKHIIWSPGNENVSTNLVLLNTGNLVLRDSRNSSRIFWQSFDHPSDTWLPGAPLGFNLFLTSDYYNPIYALSPAIDPNTARGFIIQDNSMNVTYHGAFPDWMDIREDSNNYVTFYDTKEYSHLYVKLSSWQISIFQWFNQSSNSKVLWSEPGGPCDYYPTCGAYGLCQKLNDVVPTCSCPFGFQPESWGNGYYKGYCLRNIPLDCEIMKDHHYVDSFNSIDNIKKFPDNPQFLVVRNEDECKTFCFRNCSCTAYSYTNSKCDLWFGELFRTTIGSDGPGDVMNIRVRNMVYKQKKLTFRTGKRNHIIMLILGIVAVSVVGLVAIWLYKRKYFLNSSVIGNLVFYSYAQIKRYTKNFSQKLGEGGFGTVFKGQLSDSSFVAVKKLKIVCYEEKQFRSEIQTIGIIRHVNLVRLLGFCAEGTKRLLVYEYMPNGSLNSHIFPNNSEILTWKTRYQIVVGIARGLAYLHEECRDCIIHCDIKPENILLDDNFYPKIADFGMAKLLGRNFSRALTTMRGTVGYLAPEWVSGQPITQKADVYSFGMMLFEIISGRRNVEKIKNGECTYFPLYAAIKINQGEALCLLDERLEINGNVEELEKACKVACWCIQDFEDNRPTMRQAVQMLEGFLKIEMPPIPKSLQIFVNFENDSSYCEP